MTPEQKNALRIQIEQAIEEAELTLVHLKESSKAVAPDNAMGRLTRMDAMGDLGKIWVYSPTFHSSVKSPPEPPPNSLTNIR